MPGNDANTVSLLHFNAGFVDENVGGSGKIWSAVNSAAVSSTESKFGGSSLFCSGSSGQGIKTPAHADFQPGSADFTADVWFYRSGGTGNRYMFANFDSGGLTQSIYIRQNNGNLITGQIITGVSTYNVTGTTVITTTGWHHVALVRTGNTLKLFLNGVQEGGDVAVSGSVSTSSNSYGIGSAGDSTTMSWNGYLDQFRFSKSARWTANFTPPALPYGRDLVLTQTPTASVALAGASASLKASRRLSANLGVVAASGQATALRLARRLTALVGNVSVGGQSVLLDYVPNTTYQLSALSRNIAVAGQATALRRGLRLSAQTGQLWVGGGSVHLFSSKDFGTLRFVKMKLRNPTIRIRMR